MVIKEFAATDFRNYRELFVSFSEHFNIVFGQNGQGKTNLVEGLHILTHLQSFRTQRREHLIRFTAPEANLQATVLKNERQRKARVEISRAGRRVWLEDQPVFKTSDYIPLFYSLLFNPDSLYNYRHYPAERRILFDRFFSFLDSAYLEEIKSFRAVHAQKNSLLKSGDFSSLFDWNRLFMEKARGIIEKRETYIRKANHFLGELYQGISGREPNLSLSYRPSLKETGTEGEQWLERMRDQEIQAGHALYGPHRDDFQMFAGETREIHFSQGEYRIALVALKLTFNRMLDEQLEFHPLIILDDLFSELDEQIRTHLTEYLAGIPNQIFITTTQPPHTLRLPDARIMEVRDGSVV